MNITKLILAGLALNCSASFAADCTPPTMPKLPDGTSATMDQMVAGQQAVRAFQSANLDYMGCLDPMIEAAAGAAKAKGASDADREVVKQLEEQYNAAVSREEEVAGQFNTALRAFKAANPG